MAEDEAPDYESLDNCSLVGESVAKMHQTFDCFQNSRRRTRLDLHWLLENSISVIRGYIKDLPEKLNFIDAVADNVRTVAESVPEETLDIDVCHGDLHEGNLHIFKGKVMHFDFEECAFGYRVYDLATFKWGACRGNQGPKRCTAFMDGYSSIRPATAGDLRLADLFIIIRELAEVTYGIKKVHEFGRNHIMATDINYVCERLKKLAI